MISPKLHSFAPIFYLYFLTVRHTGTHFGFNFLTNIGKKSGTHYFHLHLNENIDGRLEKYAGYWNPDFAGFLKSRVLFTARDPYLGAIRVAGVMENVKSSQANVDQLVREWNCFINLDLMPKQEHRILDIGCREADRYKHLCEITEFLGIDPNQYPDLKKFADEWMPVNITVSEHKARYIETGELSSKIDFSGLEPAYEWYANLKTNDK